MNGANSLFDQLLKTGLAQVQGARDALGSQADLGKYARGAAAGGVLGLLLGNRGGRRLGGKVLKVGGVVALGALAWKTYQDWQAQQQAGQGTAQAPAAADTGAAYAALPAPQAEAHGRAMLKAFIAAAKSDGHVDERERQHIEAELQRSGADAATRAWVQDELRRPVEPAEVAALATSPEQAAELYLASVIAVDETSTMERAYLDALARRLQLDAGLQRQLEAQAAAA